MQAYMSAVHGVMDLEVGCTWRNYGDIYYLTEEQVASPQVQQAILRRWIIPVSDMEVKYASMDHRKVVGPKPARPVRSTVQPMAAKSDAQMDSLKRDIAKLNADVQNLAESLHSIVEILSKGIPVVQQESNAQSVNQTQPMASISEQMAEELFIPTFRVKESVTLKAETSTVADASADKALEELKKMKKKKKDTSNDG